MRVVYFGTYSSGEGYPRNRVLIEGLRRAGVEVVECHEEVFADAAEKIAGASGGRGRLRLGLRYAKSWIALAVRYLRTVPHDAVVVGYTGQLDVFLARALSVFSSRPVVLDAFISLYDTLVEDRGLLKADSWQAKFLAWLDRASCRLADRVLLDTRAHVERFVERTGLPAERFARIFVGEDDRVFRPDARSTFGSSENLLVLWFGTYVPLQGAEVVLRAAELLAHDPVRVRMIGRGQELSRLRPLAERLPNVSLVDEWLSYEDLVAEIRSSDLCLGIFGDTEKARRVIPCKVFDALASGRPVVTADTPAVRELLTHGEDALLVPPGNPVALAGAIRGLAADRTPLGRLGANGLSSFRRRASPTVLGRELASILRGLGSIPGPEESERRLLPPRRPRKAVRCVAKGS